MVHEGLLGFMSKGEAKEAVLALLEGRNVSLCTPYGL